MPDLLELLTRAAEHQISFAEAACEADPANPRGDAFWQRTLVGLQVYAENLRELGATDEEGSVLDRIDDLQETIALGLSDEFRRMLDEASKGR